MRNLRYLKKSGVVIVNNVPVKPVTESLNETGYDGIQMINYLKEKVENVIEVDASELLAPLGSSKYFNVAVLGVLIGTNMLGIDEQTVVEQIKKRVPERFLEIDMKAFNMGKQIGEGYEAK